MKKINLFFVILLLAPVYCHAGDYIGTYTTKPEIFPGFNKPYSEKVKKVMERMTWKMKISETHISIIMMKEELLMKYSKEGSYLLAINNESDTEKYFPFYVKDGKTIHGFGSVFFREE